MVAWSAIWAMFLWMMNEANVTLCVYNNSDNLTHIVDFVSVTGLISLARMPSNRTIDSQVCSILGKIG